MITRAGHGRHAPQVASEPMPFDEVVAVLADAASSVSGGPPALIGDRSRRLVAALVTAGFRGGAERSARPAIDPQAGQGCRTKRMNSGGETH